MKQGLDLLIFAYAELSCDGDAILKAAGLGRAHRRALYFLARKPDIAVAELLGTLKVTKQSLSRVVNELLAAGLIERRASAADRRVRLLRLSAAGAALEQRLWEAQRPRLVRAFREAGPENVAGFRRVLDALTPRREVRP